jgi:hypothetical protein
VCSSQVASWDPVNKYFNFYERFADLKDWVWVGNSPMALDPKTSGKGPFMGHISGSLVMKELK